VSVTAVIEARSQEQIDAIYQDLTDCGEVLMAL
jgi:putative lipoic acid-binding regulatory protein